MDYSPQYDTYSSDEYPPDWQARRQKVLKRDNYVCQICGLRSTRVDDVRFDVDHIVPKSESGSHALENLQTLCPSCHANKHPGNRELRRRGKQFERRNKPSLLVRFTWLILGLFVSSVGPDDRTVIDEDGRRLQLYSISEAAAMAEETGVTVEVAVIELWDSNSDNVQQMGRVRNTVDVPSTTSGAEKSNEARFVTWAGNGHPQLEKGRKYRIIGAKTNQYNGEFQLVIDGQSAIQSQ